MMRAYTVVKTPANNCFKPAEFALDILHPFRETQRNDNTIVSVYMEKVYSQKQAKLHSPNTES